jgi:hypothetical protein
MFRAPPATSHTPPPLPRGPSTEPCARCGAPLDRDDRFCATCGLPHPVPGAPRAGPSPPRHIRCQTCGAEVTTDLQQRSYVCPFCDSTYVIELPPQLAGTQRPEFVIGFAIPPQEALAAYHRWIAQRGWFRPGDLKSTRIDDKLRGVYLPFWSFAMRAESRFWATIGEYWYRTQTYTVLTGGRPTTRTRRVRETEWWPLSGRHHAYYSGYLVSGSRGLSQSDAECIGPFELAALKRYEPYFLAGWLSEEYSVSRQEAEARCREEFLRREQQAVRDFLPGDTHRDVRVQTRLEQLESDLILLPVYVLTYRYRGRLYRFLMNGQTGRIYGVKPVSWLRIGLAVAAAGLLAAAIAALLLWAT